MLRDSSRRNRFFLLTQTRLGALYYDREHFLNTRSLRDCRVARGNARLFTGSRVFFRVIYDSQYVCELLSDDALASSSPVFPPAARQIRGAGGPHSKANSLLVSHIL